MCPVCVEVLQTLWRTFLDFEFQKSRSPLPVSGIPPPKLLLKIFKFFKIFKLVKNPSKAWKRGCFFRKKPARPSAARKTSQNDHFFRGSHSPLRVSPPSCFWKYSSFSKFSKIQNFQNFEKIEVFENFENLEVFENFEVLQCKRGTSPKQIGNGA